MIPSNLLMTELKDIETREDVVLMVDTFYHKVQNDELIGPVFNDIAKVDWESHLPIMYGFWTNILLGTGEYNGRPFPKHIPLPIGKEHFDRWIALFHENMDEHFHGKNADLIKQRAVNIGGVFHSKLKYFKQIQNSTES